MESIVSDSVSSEGGSGSKPDSAVLGAQGTLSERIRIWVPLPLLESRDPQAVAMVRRKATLVMGTIADLAGGAVYSRIDDPVSFRGQWRASSTTSTLDEPVVVWVVDYPASSFDSIRDVLGDLERSIRDALRQERAWITTHQILVWDQP